MTSVSRHAFRLSLLSLIIISASGYLHAKEWRGIVPLHSARAEVEKLVGPPTTPGGSIYRLAEETLSISYSSGPCIDYGSWNIAKGTVIYISVSPREKTLLKDLDLNLSEYEKKQDPHLGDIKYYVNDKDGMRLTVNEPHGSVDSFLYYPSAQEEQDPAWHCPEKQPKEETVDKGDLMAEFSDYWADHTRDQLEGVEGVALADPRAKIYIVYSSKDDASGKIRLFAELTKQHMVEQNIKAERIILMDDKVRNKGFVEVWLCPER